MGGSGQLAITQSHMLHSSSRPLLVMGDEEFQPQDGGWLASCDLRM